MNQNFSSNQLIKLCKQREWEDYDLEKDDLEAEIDYNFTKIINGTFNFQIEKIGEYFLTHDLSQKLIIRKLNDNLKRLYKDEQANRRIIIKQVKTLLTENCPMWILRTDIEKFYESIDRERLISKLRNDSILSFHSLSLLNKLFDNQEISQSTGLPRGMSISATLSELYMRKFDKWIQRNPGIYFYARFVDDIIIFSNDVSVIKRLNSQINDNLEEGLNKKVQKTGIYNGNNISKEKPLEYLGYQFTSQTTNKGEKNLEVSIAKKKIKKIKTRVTLALLDHVKKKNFNLIEKRIKFLTGNYSVKANSEGNDLKAGIYYNYSHLTKYDIFDDLNLYFRKALFSKSGKFGSKIDSALTQIQKDKLAKYSFKHGFVNMVYCSFTPEDMKEIKSCW